MENTNDIVLKGHSVDLDWITTNLERGHNQGLVEVMGMATSEEQRKDILTAIQGINAEHRLARPQDNLPELSFKEYSDWPSSWGKDLVLESKQGGKEKELYEEMDWQDDNNKVHRVYPHF